MQKVVLLLFCFGAFFMKAQNQSDTLFFEDFMKIVKAHHPFMQRSKIITLQADANLMFAKGNFDPKVFADLSQKYFDGDQYYSLINTGVSIPTWFGLSFYSGYDQTDGSYLNPQFRTPENGLVYAGAQLTLGQGLLIDKRRADLKQAKLFNQIAEHERVLLVNQLLSDAAESYWNWYAAHSSYDFIQQAYQVASLRFEAVKKSASFGERASIDTLELSIQLQNLLLVQQDLQLQEQNCRLELGLFLWADGNIPVELNLGVAPSAKSTTDIQQKLMSLSLQVEDIVSKHPEIQRDMTRLDQQQIEVRLRQEMLKPILNLKYNAINEPIGNNLVANYSLQNYTWGLDFEIPILLRKERAQVNLAKLRLEDMSLTLDYKRQLLLVKANASINQWRITQQQYELYDKNVQDISRLLDAENTRFNNGESSVFLVNTRENNLVNAQIKLFELYSKSQKAIFKTYFSLAQMEAL